MSSSFQEQLDAFQPPSFEDIELTLPPRRERSANDGTSQRPSGEHGGASDGSPVASEAHAGAAASSGSSEPQPQRDDPDEGEHTDSTESQIAKRLRPAEAETHATPSDETSEPSEHDRQEVAADEPESPNTDIEPAEQLVGILARTKGTSPRPYTRIAFSAGDDVESLSVTRFPQPLVDKLRLVLAQSLGGEFAEGVSATTLLTGYMVAQLGVRLDLDENTRAAVEGFRHVETRLSAVEDRMDVLLESIDRLAGAQKYVIKRVTDTGKTVDALDLAAAYLVTDRVAGLSTSEVDETNIVVTQKKVLSTRTRIHEQAATQKKFEQDRNERSNA